MDDHASNIATKVASITLTFWILKIIATTLGETAGDVIGITSGFGYFAGIMVAGGALSILLVAQLRVSRFMPVLYWAVIVSTTTAGTEISDFIDRSLGLGYPIGAALLAAGLMGTLFVWRISKGKISVDPVYERSTEFFYWIAILFSNSLGTAFGDFLSDYLGIGYVPGAAITAAIIAVVVILHYASSINGTLLFWVAFVFTRPFGATFGDFLTKPIHAGGLALSTVTASIVGVVLMISIVLVAYYSAGISFWSRRHSAPSD